MLASASFAESLSERAIGEAIDIYQYLHQLNDSLGSTSAEQLESTYRRRCQELSSLRIAERIGSVNTVPYTVALQQCLKEALFVAHKEKSAAIYFEYDMENEWQGWFYVCRSYSAAPNDFAWVYDHSFHTPGPTLGRFTEIYNENGFDDTELAIGSTLYLTARTIASLSKACVVAQIDLPTCISYYGQDTVTRINPHGTSR